MLMNAGLMLARATKEAAEAVPFPTWLYGIWGRADKYVMDPAQDGAANDGLTASTSWPAVLRYPCTARTSAAYPSPNGTKAFPDGVKVVILLPGDYSMRKMHSVRTTEYWPHWDLAPDVGLEADAENPLIVVFAEEYNSYTGMREHPMVRGTGREAIVGTIRASAQSGTMYVHGLSSTATVSGIQVDDVTDCKQFFNKIITEDASAVTRSNGTHRNEAAYNYCERRYPWSSLNDYAGLYLKDGPNDDCWDHHNIVINYADSMQGACRATLYRQDPLTINITAPGTGYTVGDALVFGAGTAGAVYRNAVGTVTAVDGGGGITAVTCADMGAYDGGGFPSVTIVGTGTGATFTCTGLAGPLVAFGKNLVAPDIWEQGWPENTGYGGIKGYLCEDNWFGCTDEVKNSNVYSTIGGVENLVDLKTGGTVDAPAIFRRNKYFGLRANLWSPSAVFTFHDVCSYVKFQNEMVADCSSVLNLNAQYHNDRYANDGGSTGGTAYPAWESFTTVEFNDCIFADINNFATTGSWAAMQGRFAYGSNSLTLRFNSILRTDYMADEAVNASAADLVLNGNLAHTPIDLDGWTTDWTDGTVSSGYREVETVEVVPYTTQRVTFRKKVPT